MPDLPRALEQRGLELVGHNDLDGRGDGMQIMRNGDVVYVGHMGDFRVGTSVVDVADPRRPHVLRQIPVPNGTHSHKVQLADGLLLANHEQYPYRVGASRTGSPTAVPESAGLLVYDVSRPSDPRQVGFLAVDGLGVHRIWYAGGRYAYASARENGFRGRLLIVVDLADPSRPRLASRWWWPGQRDGDAVTLPQDSDVGAHHVIVKADRAYGGYFDAGVVVYRVAPDGSLDLISSLSWSERAGGHPHTHTALPLGDRDLLVVTDEAIEPNCEGARKDVHVVDVSDEQHPKEVSRFPVPEGDYCKRGLRFGPHNVHENRPGTFQSDRVVFVTYFNAGLRAYDVADPLDPREIAAYVPEPPPGQPVIQFNDVLVSADGLIFATDRVRGGLYVLRRT
ncbi:MAG TPA: hypothetical protein VFA01_03370 [Candidatus Dormibacteraeota bacterium]|nr:hypothetical protein [Candidatus Dormibacteraeota bacterium]